MAPGTSLPRPFKAHRLDKPWGHHITFAMNEPCSVKLLFLKKGQAISWQRHELRDQFYFILDKGFEIWDGPKDRLKPKPGDTFTFPRQILHRAIYNGDKQYGRYLEVSFGQYDEDDIERLDDMYGRYTAKQSVRNSHHQRMLYSVKSK